MKKIHITIFSSTTDFKAEYNSHLQIIKSQVNYMKLKYFFVLLLFFAANVSSQETGQTFLSLNNTGVEEFLNLHPDYDGRGTIIFILDTGVDTGVEGLTKTSTGETKIIDVQDFSGQGKVAFYEAERNTSGDNTTFSNEEQNLSIKVNADLLIPSSDDIYYIGFLSEMHFINSESGSADLNGNSNTEDNFTFIVYKTNNDEWVTYIDTNNNGNLFDEKPIKNYKENQDQFTIKNENGLEPFSIGINILPEEKVVSFHFDDGSHGSHCAGIAAGYNIGGIGLNGVAPGAKVISLKIGHNDFSGGATVTESMKNAYLYADKLSKEMNVPCIISMSYGVGSEIEGKAEMEKFLDKLLQQNPYLYVNVSNGNTGPGLSSSGLPASSQSVFSSGAVLTVDVGRDNYGAQLHQDIILHFSSRGGDTKKPDIISPGAATSTVPNFTPRDRFWGTSMASPYTAGVMALLLSAANKEFPGVKIPSHLLFRIVREGATHLSGYNILDQGAGYINVMNSYELLKKYLKSGEAGKFESYTVTSFAPNQPDSRAQGLYLRDGSFLNGEEVFSYNITRNNIIGFDKFYRAYNLKNSSDWLLPVQKKTYIRNDQPTTVNVKLDKNKFNKPGLYTDKITAVRDDGSNIPEFEMIATVIIPYEFNSSNNYTISIPNQSVDIGKVDRYFIKVPAGQNILKLTKYNNANDYYRTRMWLFDPDGINIYVSPQFYSVNNTKNIESVHYNLLPGVYEINVDGLFLASDTSHYNLTIELIPMHAEINKELTTADNTIDITSNTTRITSFNVSGELKGYEKKYTVVTDGNGNVRLPFTLKKNEPERTFNFTLSKEDFNKITDFSFIILDETGKALEKNGLSNRTASVSVKNKSDKDEVNYVLLIVPGFANKESTATVFVTERTSFPTSVNIDVKDMNRQSVTLYPSTTRTLKCSISNTEFKIPNDTKVFGSIYFKSPTTEKTEYELPIYFKF